MKYIVTINDKNYEVEVERGSASIVSTSERAMEATVAAVVEQQAPVIQTAPAVQTTSVAGEAVKAPLPGVILDIKVQIGSTVKKGDILLIIEAMKMENEVMAPRDGVVSQIVASKGANVATDDVLLALK